MRATSLLMVTLLVTVLGGVASADEPPPPADRSKKTARWKPELLYYGQGWWCRDGMCWRDRESCQAGKMEPVCTSQKRAWAVSYFSWGEGRLTPTWLTGEWSTRALCEQDRGHLLTDDDSTNISPCTSVGDKREPPRKRAKLPRGKGWWCLRWRNPVSGEETSSCQRKESECEEGIARIMSPAMSRVAGRIEVTRACQRARTAWATEIGGPEPMFAIFESQAHCEANLLGNGCKVVK